MSWCQQFKLLLHLSKRKDNLKLLGVEMSLKSVQERSHFEIYKLIFEGKNNLYLQAFMRLIVARRLSIRICIYGTPKPLLTEVEVEVEVRI